MSRRRPGRAQLPSPRRSRRARLAVAGLALAALAAAAPAEAAPLPAGPAAGIPAAPGPKKGPKCDGAAGWGAVTGRPSSLAPLGTAGLYVWNERGQWRIAATHGDKRPQLFQGTITFDAPVTRANGIEGKSTMALTGPSSVSFTFKNYGQVDGVTVVAACATTVTVAGQVDGQPIGAASVFVGANATNPSAVPVVLARGAVEGTPAAAPSPAAAAVATTAAPTTTVACAAASPWPAATGGRPPVNRVVRDSAGSTAVFAWSDRNTWRLLVATDPGTTAVVEGRITAPAPLTARIVDAGGRDGGRPPIGRDTVRVDGNTVTFRVQGTPQGVAIELGTGCAASMAIESLVVDGASFAAGSLVVGAGASTPASLPYVVAR